MNASGLCYSPTSNEQRWSHYETTSGGRVSHATRCGLRSSAATAVLSGNSCRDFFFVNVSTSAVATQLNPELHWGWDGASLESVSAFSHDPAGYRGGINLYEYCGDDPLTRTDPSGKSFLTFYDNGKGQLCGYSIWLLTGSWCANPDVVIAATDAHEKYTSCFCHCELTTHKCVAGQILTTVEVISGPIAALGARVPKSPSFFFGGFGLPNYPTPTPGDYDTVAMWLAGWLGANKLGSAFSRVVAPVGRAGAVGAALAEAGIAAKCWVDCK